MQQLLIQAEFASIHAYARRALPDASSAKVSVNVIQSTETDEWASQFPTASRATSQRIFFTALGTTRPAAGSFEAQRKVDYDLQLDLIKAAKSAGVQTCVLISSRGSSPKAMWPYPRMKGELEEQVKQIGFQHAIILRPGLIMGTREDRRPFEFGARKVAAGLKALTGGFLSDGWAQEAPVIARAAIQAALDCATEKRQPGVWVLEQADILKLGIHEG